MYTFHWRSSEGSSGSGEKLSYVKSFESWGWIIGTGVYTKEVAADYQRMQTELWIVFGIIGGISLLLFGVSSTSS